MPSTALGPLAVGFVLGLRHALDVDHLAAVSTIVSQRRSLWSSSLVGAVWGLGHTASLLAVGVLVIGLHSAIPPAVAHVLELGVAVMLIGLGANLLRTVLRGDTIHHHAHTHDGHHHVHPHVHPVGTGADVAHHHMLGAGRRPGRHLRRSEADARKTVALDHLTRIAGGEPRLESRPRVAADG